MMKHVLTLFLITICAQCFAQTYQVEWGEPYRKEGGIFSTYQLIGMEDDHYFMTMKPRKVNTLLKYDMNHKLVDTKELNHEYNGAKIPMSKIVKTKDKRFGYAEHYDKKTKKKYLFVSEFKDGQFGKLREAYSYDYNIKTKVVFGLGGIGVTNSNDTDASTFDISKDENRVSIVRTQSSIDNKKQEELAVAVFDSNMDKIWSKTQKLRYQDKIMNIVQSTVSNKGIVYILGYLEDRTKKKSQGRYLNDYKVFIVTENGMTEHKVDLGRVISPVDAGIHINEENQSYVIAGFYTEGDFKSEIKGIFYATGSNEADAKLVSSKPFTKSFLDGLASKRNQRKDKGLDSEFNIKKFLIHEDGKLSFIAEEVYIVITTSRDSKGNVTRKVSYHTNDLIIGKFDADGELEKLQKVDKRFSSSSKANVSYVFATHNGKYYLIYNDFKSREEVNKLKSKGKGNGSRFFTRYTDLLVIDGNGEIEYNETLFTSKDMDLEFVTKMSDYNDGVLLLGSMKTKNYAFGTLQLK